MSYLVLARKYRPTLFEEVVGQDAVAKTLKNAVQGDRVAHAYLFTGPRGVGKTSMARILSKALNCESGPTPSPCGKCANCLSIAKGSDMDVQEIDGASNRGIDEVRAIRENAYYQSSRSRFRIYIIDEVHMLTTQAFNALLKILEEPPRHVKFIFATTQPQSIPDTIRSRCQRFDFRAITSDEIAARLAGIAKSEKVDVEQEALSIIAHRARGGMRDAQSLLDQLLALGRKRVTADDVRFVLGFASSEDLLSVIRAMAAADASALLERFERLMDSGQDPGEFVSQLLEVARDMLVISACGGKPPVPLSSGADSAKLAELASSFARDDLLYMVQLLNETRRRLSRDVEGRILLETALLRLASMKDLEPISAAIERLDSIPLQPPAREARNEPSPAQPPPKPSWTPPDKKDGSSKSAGAQGQEAPRAATVQAGKGAPNAGGSPEALYAAFVDLVQARRKQLAAYIREGRLVEHSTDSWTIGFPADRGFHRDRVQDPQTRTALEELLAGLAGRKIALSFTMLGETGGTVIDGITESDAPAAPQREEPTDEPPMVSKARKLFKGRIVEE